jgi:hypothetical protein
VTGRRRPLLIAVVEGFNTLGAGLGAIALAGGWIDLGETLTARLPWGKRRLRRGRPCVDRRAAERCADRGGGAW